MVRPSRINPKKSPYNKIWGNFDYDATPLGPPGCNVVVHNREHSLWGPRGTQGWYITRAKDHYYNHKCLVKKTGAIKIFNAVEFFPHQITMPGAPTDNRLATVLDNLKIVLKNPHWKLPLILKGSKTNDAITAISNIFKPPKHDHQSPRVIKPPRVPEPPPIDTQPLRRSKRIAASNKASSALTPKQFAALALITMKRTAQDKLAQFKSYRHPPTNGLPCYLSNAVFDKETNQWLEIWKVRNHANPET